MKRRVFLICLIIFCLTAISIFVGVGIAQKNNSRFDYEIEEVKEIDFMVFKENNKFGVINKKGEVIVQPKYDIVQIPNPSKPVFICKYSYNAEKNQYSIKVLNDKSEQILYQYVIVEPIELNSGISQIPYEKSVLKFAENGKFGLIDFQGKVIVKAKYDEINSFDFNEGLLIVKEKDKYGIININGAVVLKPKYDKIESDGYYEEGAGYKKSGFIVSEKSGDTYKYGYIGFDRKKVLDMNYDQIARIPNTSKNDDIYLVAIQNGKVGFYKNKNNVIKHEYEDMAYDANNNCLILQKDSKQGIADLDGNTVVETKYDNIYVSGKFINAQIGDIVDIYDYSNKEKINYDNVIGINQTINEKYSIAIVNNDKFKILKNDEKTLSDNEYEYLEYVYDDYFITFKNKKFGVIDVDNNKIIDFKYDNIQKIGDTKLLQASNLAKNKKDIISKDKVIASMGEVEIYINDKYIVLQTASDRKYIDFEGNDISLSSVEDKGLYAFCKNKKWGFNDKDGNTIVDAQYDFVTEFNEYGFAGIKKAGKWGVINSSGEVIVEPQYEIESNNPQFVGKYYECDLGYGQPYFISE